MSKAWRLGRTAVAVLALGALAGCAVLADPQGTKDEVGGLLNGGTADQAMAAVTRGDFSKAEVHALSALKRDPKDPYALIAAGLAYQGSGRYDLARQYYQVILTNQSQGTLMVPGEGGVMMPRAITDVARSNLAVIDKVTGRFTPRTIAESGRPPGASAIGLPPMGAIDSPVRGAMAAGDPLPPPPDGVQTPGRVSEAEANVAGRFRILKTLLDDGLITPEEYKVRRGANLGALLPYAEINPGQGLERPIPKDRQVVGRLQALGQALEAREIGARELAAERATILDALLPSNPRRLDLPVLPPRDMIEAGAAVGRVERMRAAGLVSDDEVAREKAAIEKALDRQLGRARVDGSSTGLRHGKPEPMETWGVHLASLKTEKAARAAWESLKHKHADLLGGLEPRIAKVTLKGKGTRWRVVAAPLDGKDAALRICKGLKVQRQFCDPLKVDK